MRKHGSRRFDTSLASGRRSRERRGIFQHWGTDAAGRVVGGHAQAGREIPLLWATPAGDAGGRTHAGHSDLVRGIVKQ
jgi:hypothetical protein